MKELSELRYSGHLIRRPVFHEQQIRMTSEGSCDICYIQLKEATTKKGLGQQKRVKTGEMMQTIQLCITRIYTKKEKIVIL